MHSHTHIDIYVETLLYNIKINLHISLYVYKIKRYLIKKKSGSWVPGSRGPGVLGSWGPGVLGSRGPGSLGPGVLGSRSWGPVVLVIRYAPKSVQ